MVQNKIININKRINNNVRHNGLKINIHGGAAAAAGYVYYVNSLTIEFFGTNFEEFNNDNEDEDEDEDDNEDDNIKFKRNDNNMIENWDFSPILGEKIYIPIPIYDKLLY